MNHDLNKPIYKKCKDEKCGVTWIRLPKNARYNDSNDSLAGIYFECDCGSTMVILDKAPNKFSDEKGKAA